MANPSALPRCLVALAVLLLGGCASLGGLAVEHHFNAQRDDANLREHVVVVEGLQMPYVRGGEGEQTLLLLHGFSGAANNWFALAQALTPHYDVVAPELPPFGEADFDPKQTYGIDDHLRRTLAFIDAVGLRRVVVVGNSMGGHLAAELAAARPDLVSHLVLIDAAGVRPPKESPFQQALRSGANPFVMRSDADADRFFSYMFVNPPAVPGPAKAWFRERARRRADLTEQAFADYLKSWEEVGPLEDKLPQLTLPTLVIWGREDRVLDVSSVDVFMSGLPNARRVILEGCGHVPMMECPQQVAAPLLAFLQRPAS